MVIHPFIGYIAMFYCLVIGSRGFDNYPLLKSELDKLLVNHHSVTIVSGCAKGADTLAESVNTVS